MRFQVIVLGAILCTGIAGAPRAQDDAAGAVEHAMTCWDDVQQVWRRYEKIGETIRAVEGDVAAVPDRIHEFDDANQRYVLQLKTYAGKFDVEIDYKNLKVVKESVTGQQVMECKS